MESTAKEANDSENEPKESSSNKKEAEMYHLNNIFCLFRQSVIFLIAEGKKATSETAEKSKMIAEGKKATSERG